MPDRDLTAKQKPGGMDKLVNDGASLDRMRDASLFNSVKENREQARKLRQAARERRAEAEATMARARILRRRVHQLDIKVQDAKTEVKRQTTLRDASLDALKQSLRDLETVRMAPSGNKGLDKLKADIRKTVERSR